MKRTTAAQLKQLNAKAKREKHQKAFAQWLRLLRIRGFVEEHRFHPRRQWRFDFADPQRKIAVELDGGVWGGKSGHNSGKGIISKMEKSNEAARLGWRVFSFHGDEVQSGAAAKYIEAVIQGIDPP